jgi:acylphosphatase
MVIMKVTYEIIVRGRVQGVGYRWFVKKQADLIGIKGYVKNQANGNVLIIAQGEEAGVDLFISIIQKGSDFSIITSTEVNLITSAKEYQDFFIAA